MGNFAHLRHVGIRSGDIPRTADFYARVFGLTIVDAPLSGQGAVLSDGIVNVTIVPIVDETSATGPVVEGSEPIHLGFVVSDLAETFRRCQELGATILAGSIGRDPVLPGVIPSHSFKVADPNGNVVDVIADPHHWKGMVI
ncbi:MAG TPA: VOC family protein [Chloroflexota bacterium]|nr:VOC family protein [Chloroflexota bacterium]